MLCGGLRGWGEAVVWCLSWMKGFFRPRGFGGMVACLGSFESVCGREAE